MGKLGATPLAAVIAPDYRAAVVTALGAVPGLVPSSAVPDVPTEGAAWPTWVQSTFNGVLASPGRPAYDVYVLLPAGYALDTVEKGDGLLGQVCEALWDIAVVQLAEPVNVRFENQTTMPGLRLRILMRGQNNS